MTGARGEAYVDVEGEQLPILLTNRALAEVEKATGVSMFVFTHATSVNELIDKLSVNVVVELLRAGMQYGRLDAGGRGKPYTLHDAWKVMDACGLVPITLVVAEALGAVLSYQPADGAADEADPT